MKDEPLSPLKINFSDYINKQVYTLSIFQGFYA